MFSVVGSAHRSAYPAQACGNVRGLIIVPVTNGASGRCRRLPTARPTRAGPRRPSSGPSCQVALAAGPNDSLRIEATCRVVAAMPCRSSPLSSFAPSMPRFWSATNARANLPDGAYPLSEGRDAGDPCDLAAPGAMVQCSRPSSHSDPAGISGTAGDERIHRVHFDARHAGRVVIPEPMRRVPERWSIVRLEEVLNRHRDAGGDQERGSRFRQHS